MTCKERLKLEHPEMVNEKYIGGCNGCPKDYGYVENTPGCFFSCTECWNREIIEDVKIGCLYRHYKGGLYRVIAIATETETEEMFVIYVAVKTGKTWARRLSMFCETVGDVPRFKEVKE